MNDALPDVIDETFEYKNGFLFEIDLTKATFIAPNGNSFKAAPGVYTKNKEEVNFYPMELYSGTGVRTAKFYHETMTETETAPEWIFTATSA